ncbi:MAG: hypothetical protein ABI857_09920 [Acidobacteriota bacterium]
MVERNEPAGSEYAHGNASVPSALRMWFVIHFAIDMIVALPLFFAPREVLTLFGWTAIDPLATRLAAAAFFGIGLESLMGRNAGREAFKGMLQLKLIWSAFAAIGLAWSVLEGGLKYQWIGWMLVGTFVAFHVLWWYWLLRLKGGRDEVA